MATHNSNVFQTTLINGKRSTQAGGHLSTRDTAQYIADMVLELRNLAKACQFKSIQELLEVTYYEAFGVAHKIEVPEGETEFLKALEADAKRAMTAS